MKIILLFFVLALVFPPTARAALLFSADFEGGTPSGPIGSWTTCSGASCTSGYPSVPNPQSIAIVTTARQGTKSVENIADPTWNPCWLYGGNYVGPNGKGGYNCTRSEFEMATSNNHTTTERWYGFSVYIDPSTVYNQTNDPNGPLVFQLHSGGTLPGCSPITAPHFVLALFRSGQWIVDTSSNHGTCTNFNTRRPIGAWAKGVWEDFVIHIKNSYTSTGILQVWRNGVLVVNETGPNDHNTSDNQDLTKFGVYQSWWSISAPPAGEKIVILHDGIKIGDENSSFAEVSSSSTPLPSLAAPTNLVVVVGP